jgi:RimJ/RimL family protein N-acetyltransferase
MITRVGKCSPDVIESVVRFVLQDREFMDQTFPHSTGTEASRAIASLRNSWYVLTSERPNALFKAEISEPTANISKLCYDGSTSFEAVIANLREDLRRMRITTLHVSVPPDQTDFFLSTGFEKRAVQVRLSRAPIETEMMPILPLMNPTEKEIPTLSKLMYEAYAKTKDAYSDTQSTESVIRNIMSGDAGGYIPGASFASGAFPNLVSACLLTRASPAEANVSQVFTHPLYRARGLATTEIAFAMNRLVKEEKGVTRLTILSPETNDVMKRLLDKMGFTQDGTLVEMTSRI